MTIDILSYVEQKGMRMEIRIEGAETQASFMLAALRDVRMDDRERKKKLEEAEKAAKGVVAVRGPLLGPAIKDDSADSSRARTSTFAAAEPALTTTQLLLFT